eukprot:m.734290 g.734290  ORF g.734290 m.734290 type:complete len:841 (-) comp23081_c0_seq1:1361-3883(-)
MDVLLPKSRRKARCRKAGTLLKWVNYVSGWQKRYFDLVGGTLSYYKSSEDVVAGCRGSVLLRETSIQHVGPREMILTAGSTNYHLRASSEQDLMTWITALELAKQEETKAYSQNPQSSEYSRNSTLAQIEKGASSKTAVSAAMTGLRPSPLGIPQNTSGAINTSGSAFDNETRLVEQDSLRNAAFSPVSQELPHAASTPSVENLNTVLPTTETGHGHPGGVQHPYRKHTRAGSSGSNRSGGVGRFRRTDSNESLASTFSDASDFSEHSSNYSGSHRYREGPIIDINKERDVETLSNADSTSNTSGTILSNTAEGGRACHRPPAMPEHPHAEVPGDTSVASRAGTTLVIAEDRQMETVQRASKLFFHACEQYVATCDRMLVGPEPEVEARQDIYIDAMKASQKRIGDAINRIVHEGISHRSTLAQSIAQSEHACRAATTRVNAMQQAIDRLRRVVQANQSDLADSAPNLQAQQSITTSTSLPLSSTASATVSKPECVVRTPKALTNAERLQKILSPRKLPNRPVTASHRRSMSDPLLAGTFSTAMAKGAMDSTAPIQCDKIDIDLANSEKEPITAEDTAIMQRLITEIGADKLQGLSARDYMQIIRGYKTSSKRFEETIDATRKIIQWRNDVQFGALVQTFIPEAESFHSLWRETVYGEDCFGHPVVGIRVADIDTEALGTIPEPVLVRLVAQKLAVYREYMEFISAQRGEQRYKLSYLIDMSNAGVASLLGDKKTLMQKIFGVGSTYFPESVWKIYVVNAPFALRMGWSVVKALIHPVTEAKIKIVGSVSDTKARLARDGFSPAALPKEFGGTNAGLPVWSLLQTLQQAFSHPEGNEHST